MKLDTVINENYRNLSENDLHILHYVKNNLEICTRLSISELAARCNVSTTSIIRTARKLKFTGYSDFKYFLRRENEGQKEGPARNAISELGNDIAQTIKVFQQNNCRELLYEKMERSNLGNNELASITKYNFYFQNSNIDGELKLNQTSFLTLHLIFHLIYEGYVDYIEHKKTIF